MCFLKKTSDFDVSLQLIISEATSIWREQGISEEEIDEKVYRIMEACRGLHPKVVDDLKRFREKHIK